jgi:hypothetical protein
MATAQQFDSAEIGWEAAWLTREDNEFDRLADAANDEAEAETSQPIYRTPASADGILDAAEAAAKAYQERTGCTLPKCTHSRPVTFGACCAANCTAPPRWSANCSASFSLR